MITFESYYEEVLVKRLEILECFIKKSINMLMECNTTQQYVNDYRKPIIFNCPVNQLFVVAGVESVHKNSPEDRVWRIRCCTTFGHMTTNCELTDYINNLHAR